MKTTLPKISLILPIYNVEKYLQKCLDSIVQQTFTDFEVLLIEDASTDASLAIAQAFSQKDPRFSVFPQTENRGYGAAMNKGLAHAQAAWVTFVESDDFLAPNALDLLYSKAKNEVDMVFTLPFFYNFFSENTHYRKMQWGKSFTPQILAPKDVLSIFFTRTEPWGILYKKSLFSDHQLTFFEQKIEGRYIMFQDLAISFYLKMRAKKIALVNDPIYYYRIHGNNSVQKNGKYKNAVFFPFLFEEINKQCERASDFNPADLVNIKHKIFYDIISANFVYFSEKIIAELREIVRKDISKNNPFLYKTENKLYIAFAQNKISDPRVWWVKIMRHPKLHSFFLFCKQYFYRLPEGLRKNIKT